MNNWRQTCEVIPNGVQTLSKMPEKHVKGVYPTYIDRADGAYIWSGDKKYIDYPLGLGTIILGHNHSDVNRAAIEQLNRGVIFSLPNYLETQLAEKICDIIPSAEMVRFLKTGSEATAAAVRIARAYTGKDKILCCGYHGWHDWYNITTPKNKGVPKTLNPLCLQLKYNDIETFRKKLTDRVAAVIIEPYVLEEPKKDFLQQLRKLCDEKGALLIFDEIVTALRTPKLSAQKFFDITPDLTCLGKALANGLPISCICGKKEVMQVLEGDCFVSSTWGGELLSIAAALKTIELIEKHNVAYHIDLMGQRLQHGFNRIAEYHGLGDKVKCIGYPCRTFFVFPTEVHKSLFWQECLKKGVFFGYAQFISYAHDLNELDETISAMRHAMLMVRKYWDNPERALEGEVAQETFRLVVEKKE